ncbi:25077_t:CDS:1, partial [Gigaspora rosea]
EGRIVICIAFSGLASLLLIGRRTTHSTFRIPIEIKENSFCAINKNSDLADLLRATELIFWDE